MKRGAEQPLSSKEKKIKTEQITQDVPNEIWQVIFSHLPPSFLGVVRQVSMEWRALIQNLSQQSLHCYFSYLVNHPDCKTQPLSLFIKEYQQYQQSFPSIPMDAIFSVLQGNTEGILSETNPNSQKILYGLRFAKGYPLPEKGLTEQNILEIKGWAIVFAAWQGNTKLLEKLLILQGINAQYKNMALFSAAYSGHAEVIVQLAALGTDVNTATNDGGVTPTLIAAQNGHAEVIAQLAALGADVNTATNNGTTPIFVAAQNGHVEAITQLAALGADVNTATNNGATPTFIAAQQGLVEVITQLAALGADVNTATNNGTTPIFVAAQNGHVEAITQLAALGANVNTAANDGVTPILIAAQKGHAEVVQFLLEQNVNIQPSVFSTESLSNFAKSRGNVVMDRMDQFIKEKIEEGHHAEKIPLLPSEIAYIMGHVEIVNILKTSSEVVTTVGVHLCPQPPEMTYVFNATKDRSSSSSEENTMEIDENNHGQSFFSINYCRLM